MSNKCLILFKEFGSVRGITFPSMKDYFADQPYPGKDKVVSYLKAGKKTYCAVGHATDFYTGERIPGERCGITDGEYTWNSELAYYVEKYNLMLAEDFVNKVLSI